MGPEINVCNIGRLLLAVGVLVGALSACGGAGDDDSEVSSAETSSYRSDNDVMVWMHECVEDAGVPNILAEGVSGMGISPVSGGTEELSLLFKEAIKTCSERALNEGVTRPLDYVKTEAEWQAEYDHRLESSQCLLDAGYNVENPPSLEAYIDSDGMWSAHTVSTRGLVPVEAQKIFRQCPQ